MKFLYLSDAPANNVSAAAAAVVPPIGIPASDVNYVNATSTPARDVAEYLGLRTHWGWRFRA